MPYTGKLLFFKTHMVIFRLSRGERTHLQMLRNNLFDLFFVWFSLTHVL